MVSISLHFPPPEEDEDGNVDELTPAQQYQAEIINTGIIKSTKGDLICEFSKDVGKFVNPRGAYSISMSKTFMHLQGAQYSYKIKYEDINTLFLLDKPDGMRAGKSMYMSNLKRSISLYCLHLISCGVLH